MVAELLNALPKWLTESYIADLIRSRKKSITHVKIMDVDDASEEGDNCLGSVFRVSVECNSERMSLIVKTMAKEKGGCEFISSLGVFQREFDMYDKILPQIYSAMEDKFGHVDYLTPYCYPSARTDTIVLEDLRPLGYKMADRKEQLDMDHALEVIKVLAKLHAFSYVAAPENIKRYYDAFYSREARHVTGGIVTSTIKSLSRAVSKWKGYEEYTPLLWRYSERSVESINESVRLKEGAFNVLNHGDCWANNLLFRYCPESGNILDVKLIDFQLGRYASPALDLIYFIYSSLRLEVWHQRDKLLRHYHNELIGWLSSAGVGGSVYTYQDLEEDMKEKQAFVMATTSSVTALALANRGDGPDFEKMFLENGESAINQFQKAHNSKEYRTNMQEFLPHFVKEGVLS